MKPTKSCPTTDRLDADAVDDAVCAISATIYRISGQHGVVAIRTTIVRPDGKRIVVQHPEETTDDPNK